MSLGSRTKETPKSSDCVGGEHTFLDTRSLHLHHVHTRTGGWFTNRGRGSIMIGVFVLYAVK